MNGLGGESGYVQLYLAGKKQGYSLPYYLSNLPNNNRTNMNGLGRVVVRSYISGKQSSCKILTRYFTHTPGNFANINHILFTIFRENIHANKTFNTHTR
jgi:hypothetical protein